MKNTIYLIVVLLIAVLYGFAVNYVIDYIIVIEDKSETQLAKFMFWLILTCITCFIVIVDLEELYKKRK